MAQKSKDQAERHLLQVLAEFRHQLRSFLLFVSGQPIEPIYIPSNISYCFGWRGRHRAR
jgi:hypothetical protein